MKIIFSMVIIIQIVTLSSLMYSVYGLNEKEKEITSLKKGRTSWEEHGELFQMSEIDDGGETSKAQKREFFEEFDKVVDPIFITTTLDNKAINNTSKKNNYFPTMEQVSNVIYVNQQFLKSSTITMSDEVKGKIANLSPFENMILVPETQANQYQQIIKEWSSILQNEAKSVIKDMEYPSDTPTRISTGRYANGSSIFIYAVFSAGGQLISIESFVQEPIIVVGSLYSNLQMYPDAWNMRVKNPDNVVAIIKKYRMTSLLGSLTNGLASMNQKIQSTEIQQKILLGSTIISAVCSLLLLILLNIIYFYQARRLSFVQRLAGKSILAIHKLYLSLVVGGNLIIYAIVTLFGADSIVTVIPLCYMLGILLLFFIQLKQEKKANVVYLKGE